jgi:hypothetical protein
MFGIGWTEFLVIALVLIIVVGPKDLPNMLRQFPAQKERPIASCRAASTGGIPQFRGSYYPIAERAMPSQDGLTHNLQLWS